MFQKYPLSGKYQIANLLMPGILPYTIAAYVPPIDFFKIFFCSITEVLIFAPAFDERSVLWVGKSGFSEKNVVQGLC